MSIFSERIYVVPTPTADERDVLLSKFEQTRDGVLFRSLAEAIRGCLEALGTTTAAIPVIIPVTAPEIVFSAALRAGAQPIVLDVERTPDGHFLQVSEDALGAALEELKGFIFLSNVNPPESLDMSHITSIRFGDFISTMTDPSYEVSVESKAGTVVFAIDDYSMLESGALVRTTFPDQKKSLFMVRDAFLGLDAKPSLGALKALSERLNFIRKGYETISAVVNHLTSSHFPSLTTGAYTYIYAGSKYKQVITALRDTGIVVGQPFTSKGGLLRDRYKEFPEYPGAEEFGPQVLAINILDGMSDVLARVVGDVLRRISNE